MTSRRHRRDAGAVRPLLADYHAAFAGRRPDLRAGEGPRALRGIHRNARPTSPERPELPSRNSRRHRRRNAVRRLARGSDFRAIVLGLEISSIRQVRRFPVFPRRSTTTPSPLLRPPRMRSFYSSPIQGRASCAPAEERGRRGGISPAIGSDHARRAHVARRPWSRHRPISGRRLDRRGDAQAMFQSPT